MSTHDNEEYWQSLLDEGYGKDAALDPVSNYLNASEKEAQAEIRRMDQAVESRLKGKTLNEGQFSSVRGLTDTGRQAWQVQIPVEVGTKVEFVANAGSLLTYSDAPDPGAVGKVVTVKSGSGVTTSHNGMVFVEWNDGVFRPIHAEHLKLAKGQKRKGSPNLMRVASLGDLGDIFGKWGAEPDVLVHKATKDLWGVSQDGAGFVIERLFDDDGSPLKV